MASGKTARRLLSFPKPTDADKICADIETLANQLDNDCETIEVVKESERPAAKLRGRICYVSEVGLWFWDTGTTWLAINSRAELEALEAELDTLEAVAVKVNVAAPTVLSWGSVSAAGAIEAGSGDFTLAKTGTGVYEVKWTVERPVANYAVVATTYAGAAFASIGEMSKATCVIRIFNTSGVAASNQFSFVALA